MPFTFTMPKLSPTMETGTLVKWHKNVGDHVIAGEVIVEIATDKATVEHEVLDSGWLRKILLSEGQEATVNAPLAIFTEEKDESIEGYTPEGEVSAPPPSSKEGQVSQPSAAPKEEELKAKSTPSIPSAMATTLAPKAPGLPLPSAPAIVGKPEGSQSRILASPLAKKLAKEQGLDLERIKGSGPSGRIMKRDLDQPAALGSAKTKPSLAPGTYEEIALSQFRKVIAKRLQEAKSTIPHFYVHQVVDAEGLIALREQLKNFDIGVTYNDLVLKAIALALRLHPNVNCGFNPSKNVLLSYKTIDISVAVSIEGGLITPIVTNADYKSVAEISSEVRALAKKAKEGKLQPHEFQGGSFTLSNMGMYGITDFQAIINPPQAAILAVSGINDTPVIKNGMVVPGKQMHITLSVDHRAIDGAAGVQFIKTVQKHIENPAILLM